MSHLQNCTNAIMIPHIPALWSRKPIVTLPETPSDESLADPETKSDSTPLNPDSLAVPEENTPRRRSRSQSVASRAQLSPDDALDRHVEHVLTKKDKLKRAARGLWDFLKTPMGVITAIYGFLVVFWGAAIVLFLLKWIDAGSDYNQKLWIGRSHVSSALTGRNQLSGCQWAIHHYRCRTYPLESTGHLSHLGHLEAEAPDYQSAQTAQYAAFGRQERLARPRNCTRVGACMWLPCLG